MTATADLTLTIARAPDELVLLPLVRAYHEFEHVALSDDARRTAIAPLLAGDSPFGRIWLIHAAGRTVGYVAVCFGYSIEFAGRDAFLDELYVVPDARGRGIGSAVLPMVQAECAGLRINALHLEVARDNRRARGLYEKLGFEARVQFHLMSWQAPR